MDRDEERRARNNQNRRGGGLMQSMDKDDFLRETLPSLQWAKMIDMFNFTDEVMGAKTMLDFIEANLKHPKCEEWFKQFTSVIGSGSPGGATTPAPAAPAAAN